MKEYYVLLRRRWNGANAWTTGVWVTKEPPSSRQIGILWAAKCRAHGPEEAKGIVMEWLAKGRPSAMSVEEIYSDFAGERMRAPGGGG